MGKASSAKKVARVAGLGGSRAYGSRPPYGYYFSVVILVILGLVGVYNAREFLDHKNAGNANFAPKVGLSPPWHEGFAIDECGKVVYAIKTNKDPNGLTTKGDGIIYISPTSKSAAGHNATLGKFASDIGMNFNAAEIQLPGGKLYTDGESCEGKSGHIYVEVWSNPTEPQSDGVVQTGKNADNLCQPDCDQGVLLRDDQLVTIAFVPARSNNKPPTNIPQPPKKVVATLNAIEASAASGTTTTVPTTAPTGSSTTAPTGSTTTAPTGSTTTNKSGATTSTTGSKTTKTTKPATATTTSTATGTTTTPAKTTKTTKAKAGT